MSNDTTASTSTIKTWQERTGNHNVRSGSVKHMIAEIADLRAALARAPLPAQPSTKVTLAVIGCKHFGNPIPQEWYAAAHELLADVAAPAQADEARDAARYRWLRMNVWPMHVRAPMKWFPPQFQTNAERIDMLCDQEIAASLAGKDKK